MVAISGGGSFQNPAWSPDGASLLFTRFADGYNAGSADLAVVSLSGGSPTTLVSDGSANVNLPGSTWNATTQEIVFSSSREPHDEIYVIDAGGASGTEQRITSRDTNVAYEPSFSPDGTSVVFESHRVDVEDNGVITTFRRNGNGDYLALTDAADDCREPNWSPAGDKIVYQKQSGGQWDIWVMNTDGSGKAQITSGTGDKTDPSFSPNGSHIVYSSNEGGLELANIFVISTGGGESQRVTSSSNYDGAPSWSPDASKIAFETYDGDPDGSAGTTIWTIAAPSL